MSSSSIARRSVHGGVSRRLWRSGPTMRAQYLALAAALSLAACAGAATLDEPETLSAALDTGGSEAEGTRAVTVESTDPTFELGAATWTITLPGIVAHHRGTSVRLDFEEGRTYWISRYEEGAGPIDLENATAIILDEPDPPVLFAQDRSGAVAYELVVRGPAAIHGERLIDDPDGTGATIDCSFELALPAGELAWQEALAVCRSLRLVE